MFVSIEKAQTPHGTPVITGQKYEANQPVSHRVVNLVSVNLASVKMIKTVLILSSVIACITADVSNDFALPTFILFYTNR